MTLRACAGGCGALVPKGSRGGRCTTCQGMVERARPSTTQRGYGAQHEAAKQDPAYLEATVCDTCGEEFTMLNPKTAGHRVDIRQGGRDSGIFPQCRRCNYGWRRAGA